MNGQAALPLSIGALGIPNLADFSAAERMAGEYRAMGIYPRRTPDGVRQAASAL